MFVRICFPALLVSILSSVSLLFAAACWFLCLCVQDSLSPPPPLSVPLTPFFHRFRQHMTRSILTPLRLPRCRFLDDSNITRNGEVCAWMSACTSVCVYVCVCASVYECECVRVRAPTYVCIERWMCVCMYVHASVYVCVYVRASTYACLYMYMRPCFHSVASVVQPGLLCATCLQHLLIIPRSVIHLG